MRRRHVHAIFATTLLACGLLAAVHGMRLAEAARTNAAVSRIQAGDPSAARPDAGEVELARAVSLAQSGRYEEALKAYKALAQGARDDLRPAALYDLGNLHLREAMRRGAADKAQSLALIELAKQSYRDLLRLDADAWDARYNLERALVLAPEIDEPVEELAQPLQSERAVTTMKSEGGALP
jgi:mxaK protein